MDPYKVVAIIGAPFWSSREGRIYADSFDSF